MSSLPRGDRPPRVSTREPFVHRRPDTPAVDFQSHPAPFGRRGAGDRSSLRLLFKNRNWLFNVLVKHYIANSHYYFRRALIVFEKFFSSHKSLGGAVFMNATPPLTRYDSIVFFFDDPTMHIGDQLFFKPLIGKLRRAGLPVAVKPTAAMAFCFPGLLADDGFGARPLVVSRFEVLPKLRRMLGGSPDYLLFNTGCRTIDRPVSNFILDVFADRFGPAGLGRIITADDFLDFDIADASKWDLAGYNRLLFFNNYVDSGRFRLSDAIRAALTTRLRADRQDGDYVVHLGSGADKRDDAGDYSGLVDLDLRGETEVKDLFSLLSLANVGHVYTHDTAVAHIANLFDKPLTVAFRRFFRKGERAQKQRAFGSIYAKDTSHIRFL